MSPVDVPLFYSVPGVSCDHCRTSIANEVGKVAGVREVVVDLDSKTVAVHASHAVDAEIRAAIDAAGYDVAD